MVDLPQQLSTPSPQLTRLLAGDRPARCEQPATGRPIRHLQKQRRLGETELASLVADYLTGQTVRQLIRAYRINHSTVIGHLQRQGVHVVRNGPRLSDTQVAEAALLYASGLSLATVASTFTVDACTVRRAFIRAGVARRPRRGWSGGTA